MDHYPYRRQAVFSGNSSWPPSPRAGEISRPPGRAATLASLQAQVLQKLLSALHSVCHSGKGCSAQPVVENVCVNLSYHFLT